MFAEHSLVGAGRRLGFGRRAASSQTFAHATGSPGRANLSKCVASASRIVGAASRLEFLAREHGATFEGLRARREIDINEECPKELGAGVCNDFWVAPTI